MQEIKQHLYDVLQRSVSEPKIYGQEKQYRKPIAAPRERLKHEDFEQFHAALPRAYDRKEGIANQDVFCESHANHQQNCQLLK